MTSQMPGVTRATDRIGLAGRSRAVVALSAAVLAAAVAVAVIGVLLGPGRPAGDPLSTVAGIGVATALVAAGQLARLRFRVGRGTVSVSWGEAAFIVGFALAPPGWLPLATLLGAAGAWFLISWLSDHRSLADIVHLAASLSLGAGAAAGGVLLASRLQAVGQDTAGGDFLLLAIAGPVVAGVSLFGGRGTIWAALLGALVMGSISNGMDLPPSVDSPTKFIVTGGVLLAAVVLDAATSRRSASAAR
jgi:hypothetical protein